jgi:hypothetical protein
VTGLLQGKKILLISPQPWGKMKVSKHHYAIELARRGNTVYFLNPPSPSVKRGEVRVSGEAEKNLFLLDYRPTFPMRWKYRFPGIFNLFIRKDIPKLLHAIGGNPDIVWDFEPNRQFADLDLFNASIRIYHPVDATPYIDGSTKNADMILSVSEVILDFFRNAPVPYHFINHGLGSSFSEMAKQRMQQLPSRDPSQPVRFGYVGNLIMRFIDHELFQDLIRQNPEVEFHIWGPYDTSALQVSPDDERRILGFVSFLQSQPNIRLYGLQSHDAILPVMKDLDGFFWCYDNDRDPNKVSNSHKIMEYLSTGKVVLSTLISTYTTLEDDRLIVMNRTREEFLERFREVVEQIDQFNSAPLMLARIKLALSNTYASQIQTIEELITKTKLNERKISHVDGPGVPQTT